MFRGGDKCGVPGIAPRNCSPELHQTTESFTAREGAKKRADAYGKIMVPVAVLCSLSLYILLFLVYPAMGQPLHKLPRVSLSLIMFLMALNWIFFLIVFDVSIIATWILIRKAAGPLPIVVSMLLLPMLYVGLIFSLMIDEVGFSDSLILAFPTLFDPLLLFICSEIIVYFSWVTRKLPGK